MFEKNISIDIDEMTWPGRTAPAFIRGSVGVRLIDVEAALLLLGTVTIPSIGSSASPARLWAWIRYFLALHTTPDLRITMAFSDLDPHQKGILSDDFGVAISTQWLSDCIGGFVNIVDGRKFILQFGSLMREIPRTARKVGPSKAPDYVALDASGRWHVLECKGTQSGHGARNSFLKRAVEQKSVIDIVGTMRGERLGAGLSIAHEEDSYRTHLKVVDPEADEEPLLKLDGRSSETAVRYARRLSVARALGIIGFDRLATELSLPSQKVVDERSDLLDLLLPSERAALGSTRDYRSSKAKEQIDSARLTQFSANDREYLGSVATIALPELENSYGVREVKIRQGVRRDFVEDLRNQDFVGREAAEDKIDEYVESDGLVAGKSERSRSLSYGDIFRSDVSFR